MGDEDSWATMRAHLGAFENAVKAGDWPTAHREHLTPSSPRSKLAIPRPRTPWGQQARNVEID
ncbi:hypothetical protein [Amycolatopsis taiwanensis]|uniref:Uncharacterized protein n=1 Tax=Amycolatopsis taiwanensis TaxID=342230 RepID=A0A9W6VL67_9PSEU|nr:hypothetical protein [Amycolatopsis taiwanensis]GLY71152.1 hypothetical protein Atai01_77710 [Amycolatopsis taiwanensis]